MPSLPLDVRQEQEGQTSSTSNHQLPAQSVPTHLQADGTQQRITKPLPPTRHLSLEPAAVNRPREVSSPFPRGSGSFNASAEVHNDEPNFLVRASEEVLKTYPTLDRGYLLDIMQEHFPKCTKEHIVQCTVHHFSTRSDYPRAQKSASKRKLSEGLVDDGQEGSLAVRRRIGGTPSLASSSDDGDSLRCESCKGGYHVKSTSSCPAGHLFCHLCIFKAVSAQLNSAEPLVVCLDGACSHPFTRATLLDILPHEPLGLYDTLITNHTLRQTQRVDSCPRCGWYPKARASISLEKTKRFSCETCGLESCRVCKQSAHGTMNCKDVQSTRRTSCDADSDSDVSHDSFVPTPDQEETSLPPISPLVDAFPSASEGPLLPSLRSTLALGSTCRL